MLEIYHQLSRLLLMENTALKDLSFTIHKHLHNKTATPANMLLLGSSGCGKTKIAHTLAQITQLPFVCVDVKTLSEVGYAGNDVSAIFKQLYFIAEQDTKVAEKGIVFIDEFDKLKTSLHNDKDISGLGVQSSLLKPLDGIDITFEVTPSRARPISTVTMSTKNILFIFAGVFAEVIDHNKREHFIHYGIMGELVNRIQRIIKINKPTLMQYKNALINDLEIKQYIHNILNPLNMEFIIEETFIEAIAKTADNLNQGYRGLMQIMDEIICHKIFESFENKSNTIILS